MPSLKHSATKIHLWLGLTIGLVGAYMAATGGWILFRPQADALVNPSYLTTKAACDRPLSLDRIVTEAIRLYPRSPIDSIGWQQDPRASLMVRYADEQQSYFDPCTGQLLGFHSRWTGFFGFVEKLHRFRFLPAWFAEKMAGVFAIVMAVAMGGLGLFIWWPRRRSAWKASLTLDPSLKGRAKTRNRHGVVGAFAAVGLLTVAGTGIPLAFDSVENFLFTATLSKPLKKPPAPALAPGQAPALEASWRNALALMPMPRAASLRLPTGKRPTIEYYIYDQGNPNLEGRSYLYADARTGRIVKYVPYARTPLGQRVYSWFVALHEGEVGGPIGQLLTFAAMIAILYLAYSGVRSYVQKRIAAAKPLRMRVQAIRDEATGVKSFDLVPIERRRLPRFTAGAHVEVHLPGGPKRQFSLCNGPDQRDSFTVAVRLAEESRGGSRGMHDLRVGQELLVGRPRNHFPIDPATQHAVLIAAGIGITPMLSMARHLAKRGIAFQLHYFGRTVDDMPYRDVMHSSEFLGRAHLHVGVGRARIPALLADLLADRPAGAHVYLCGPDAFMTVVEEEAVAAGWPRAAVHREDFGAPASALAGPREPIRMTLVKSQRTVTVAANETVLEALKSAGFAVASSCEQGTCGDCSLRVCGGEIDHRDRFLSDPERARGNVMLACVSRARTPELAIDL